MIVTAFVASQPEHVLPLLLFQIMCVTTFVDSLPSIEGS